MKVLGIVASASHASRTHVVVQHVLSACADDGADTEVITFAGRSLEIADGRPAERYTGDTAEILAALETANAIVIGMPVYRADMPGTLKNLLDIVPRGTYDGVAQPLRAKPVALVATGATLHHFLALNTLGEMMRGFFSAYVVPPGIYAAHSDVSEGEIVSERVAGAAWTTGRALVALGRAVAQSPELQQVEPLV